jgi:thiol-disulfide isomerase/thioredoxin
MSALKRINWKNWATNLAIILIAYAAIQAYHSRAAPSAGPAPEIQGRLLDGQTIQLSKMQGQPVLLHFWATWCGICRLEYNSIDELAQDYQVITVASQSGSRAEIRKHVNKEGISAGVLVDENGVLAKRYGIKGFPSSFVIDAEGNIYDVEVGYSTYWGLKWRLWMASL